MADERSLSALLSQVLVSFTVELDNEFERRMGEAGYPGARLSWVVWANLMRFVVDDVGDGAISVGGLATEAMAPGNQMRLQLGCLERWGFVALDGRVSRDGWGSRRGILSDWQVRPTAKGLAAIRTWQPLTNVIEKRWENRFGKEEIDNLRERLRSVAARLDLKLPHGLPYSVDEVRFPARGTGDGGNLSLPALLSQVLLSYRLEFDRESGAPLPLCANTIRVLSEEPIPLSGIARLTGGSPETTDVGWQIRPFVIVEPAAGETRGKVVRLSPLGLRAQNAYHRLTGEIEARWRARFGEATVDGLRSALLELFQREGANGLLLCEGLAPPEGTTRAGDPTPALGRRDVGSAARQRMRDLVAQSRAFLSDPSGALSHYPLWDMNRGFGP